LHIQYYNRTESTFLYQVEEENVSSVLSDSFLALNELKDPNYLSLVGVNSHIQKQFIRDKQDWFSIL
jgi:hypothetical protein